MIPEDAYGARRHGKPVEWALAIVDFPGEADLIDLGEVSMLAYQNPVPVNFSIGTM